MPYSFLQVARDFLYTLRVFLLRLYGQYLFGSMYTNVHKDNKFILNHFNSIPSQTDMSGHTTAFDYLVSQSLFFTSTSTSISL